MGSRTFRDRRPSEDCVVGDLLNSWLPLLPGFSL